MESASDFAFFGSASEESVSEGELEQDFELPSIMEEPEQILANSMARQSSVERPQEFEARSRAYNVPLPGAVPPPPPPAARMAEQDRMAAPKASMPKRAKKYKQAIDTNVMEIRLDCLGEQAEIATGDAIMCCNCGAYLNCYSELVKQEGSEDDRNWTCEFCGTLNVIQIDDEEVPQADQISYIADQFNEESKEVTSDDAYIIFCVDISGRCAFLSQYQAK